jgi:nucleoside-diphosphate-sugar epimerase
VNVARGQEVTIRRIADLVLAALGESQLGVVHDTARPGDVRRHFADIRRAQRLLDFAPTVSIEAGIPLYVEWLRSHMTSFAPEVAAQDAINWQPQVAVA